ncbi:GNAT family N-acetyltransferase [Amycolatopsis sp. NPDC006131]|uniref:GNAT family N-acetyltransferase n=1 Tax=Amycolatopsis sp. NPDC006131 TaxID=3156731 RepID=UPI0033AC4B02
MTATLTHAQADRDWRDARSLLREYLDWMGTHVGLDLTAAQPAAVAEFDDLPGFYRPPAGALVLARLDSRPAGMVAVHRLAGRTGELKRMYVNPRVRGHGLGRDLIAAAVAAATDLGFTALWLQTKPDAMPGAEYLYRSYGFTEIAPYGGLHTEGVTTLALPLSQPEKGSR